MAKKTTKDKITDKKPEMVTIELRWLLKLCELSGYKMVKTTDGQIYFSSVEDGKKSKQPTQAEIAVEWYEAKLDTDGEAYLSDAANLVSHECDEDDNSTYTLADGSGLYVGIGGPQVF